MSDMKYKLELEGDSTSAQDAVRGVDDSFNKLGDEAGRAERKVKGASDELGGLDKKSRAADTRLKGLSKRLRDDVKKDFDEAGKKAEAFNKRIDAGIKKLTPFTELLKNIAVPAAAGALAIGGVAAALWHMTDAAAEVGNRLEKLAPQVGMTVEQVSALEFAASRANVNSEQLAVGMRMLAKNANDFANGGGEAAIAFEALDIAVTDSQGNLRGTRDLLDEVADKLGGMADGSEKTAIAQRLFGESGGKLIPLLNEQSEGLEELTRRAEELGVVWSTSAAKDAAAYEDAVTDLKSAFHGMHREMAENTIPAQTELVQGMTDAVLWMDDSTDKINDSLQPAFYNMGQDINEAADNMDRFGDELLETAKTNMQPIKDALGEVKDQAAEVWQSLKSAVPEGFREQLAGAGGGAKDYFTKADNRGDPNAYAGPIGPMPEPEAPATTSGGTTNRRPTGGRGGASAAADKGDTFVREYEALQRDYERAFEQGLSEKERLHREYMQRFNEIQQSEYSDEQKEKMLDLLGDWADEKYSNLAEKEIAAYNERQEKITENQLEHERERVEKERERAEAELERKEKESEQLLDQYMSSSERETEVIAQHQARLQSLREQDIMSEQQYTQAMQGLAEQRRQAKINEMSAYTSMAKNIGKLVAEENKAIAAVEIPLEAAKVAQEVADAATDAAAGNLPAAAMHMAAAAKHGFAIKELMRVGQGGGGGSSGGGGAGGGGGPSTPSVRESKQQLDRQQSMRVKVEGLEGIDPDKFYTGEQLRGILDNMEQGFKEGSNANPYAG